MKLSCNGCRILRKGCSENCIIRPCLEWINSPESQANATLFLAKFYGRTGLLNLITAAPNHLAPAVFKSLLYEACGRIVNPTYGSMGLFWAGEWARCEAAVDAVLTGSKINGVAVSDWPNAGTLGDDHALPVFDIRHVPRVTDLTDVRDRTRFAGNDVIKPEPRVGLVETGSLLRQLERNRAGLDLELSLGFHSQSATNNTTFY